MSGVPLSRSLELYRETWGRLWASDHGAPGEIERRFTDLLAQQGCFDRSHLPGHLTGSALIITPDWSQVLLTHHRKLDKWLQLGGHADGDPRVDKVALREAQEESGLEQLTFVSYGKAFGLPGGENLILDLDIHEIPARKTDPAHDHYDVRYLIEAAHPDRITISEESNELKWFPIEEAMTLNRERSMTRLFEKLIYLRARLQRLQQIAT